jgi:hypothetical protein
MAPVRRRSSARIARPITDQVTTASSRYGDTEEGQEQEVAVGVAVGVILRVIIAVSVGVKVGVAVRLAVTGVVVVIVLVGVDEGGVTVTVVGPTETEAETEGVTPRVRVGVIVPGVSLPVGVSVGWTSAGSTLAPYLRSRK